MKFLHFLLFVFVILKGPAPAAAQYDVVSYEGLTLTLNMEMHTAAIMRISTDNRGRRLLTCSNDKTAKLWDLSTGELLRTFRPPIGEGDEGMLYAGALSPDGGMVAVGGWSRNIYIFDAASGTMLHRITGLPNSIRDLEFSTDGKHLAAALGGGEGIRVYRTTDYTLRAEDTDYGEGSHNLAFDTWGRLATVCFDGYLRLYDADFTLLKKVAAMGGKQPYSLAFSPDARLLAVGYYDSPTVQVLDAATLKLRYAPDDGGAGTMDNRLVAFSSDGTKLAANGYYDFKDGKLWHQLRIWNQAGQGGYADYDAVDARILDVKALPGGAFAFGGSQPDWGVIEPAAGQRILYRGSDTENYTAELYSHFRLGAGGNEVVIAPLFESSLQFTVPGRRLSLSAPSHPALGGERGCIEVSDWNNFTDPRLNDKALSILKKYEQVRSVDIATGGAGVVLGASWSIYCTDAGGGLRWKQPVQSAAWCVNIDEYNLVTAAALRDGTIRWYDFHDGEPLLSLYLYPDNRRWVLWTPSGYYDCSPGAESLLGWHVNNGPDKEASYYPISRFRDTYYRPDVIDLVLETLDEAEALRRAGAASNRRTVTTPVTEQLPPTVRILSPAEGSEASGSTVTIAYSIESPNGEAVTGVRISVDGRPVANQRGFKPVEQRLETHIVIPAADCAVSVIAENRFGASEPATVRLRWKGSPPPAAVTDIRPRLYVLAVGVGEYAHADLGDLEYAAKDATDFARVIGQQKGLLYQDVQVRLLTDADATKDNLLDGLDWLQKQTTSRDVAMLFFAGHGVDDNAGNLFFLPVDADPGFMRRTCLLDAEVQITVASVAGKIIVFLDACHSGSVMKTIARRNGVPPDLVAVVNELVSAENGAVVFSAATSRQYALEDVRWNNGAFTKAVVEGLSGKARTPGSNKITVKTLDAYVAERVKELTGGEQTPVTVYPPNVPDFPVGVVK